MAQLSAELYAPKVDAKDSYSASYSPRDSYYPNYSSYPKLPSSPSYAFYGSLPYPNDPYATPYNPYSPPYPVPSPSYSPPIPPYSSSYPNYYYQSPYYYPNYYNQPLFPPPPLPPPVVDYAGDPDDGYPESDAKQKKHGEDKSYRAKDVHHQFVDGANYISGGSKDLDGQPTTAYKAGGVQQNQLEQTSNAQTKYFPIPLPKTTYRVISVGGQPVGPDYPLPPSYAKAQQLDELAATRGHHDWVKVLAKNFRPVIEYGGAVDAKNAATSDDDRNDEGKDARYVPASTAIAKTGLAYVVNPSVLRKVGQRNVGRIVGKLKSVKYPTGVYATIEKPDKDQGESNDYESSSSQDNQDYDTALSQTDSKQQNYDEDQPYQNENYVTQTPRYSGYQYTSYSQPQTITQRQTQQYKSNLDNVSFGAKTKKA